MEEDSTQYVENNFTKGLAGWKTAPETAAHIPALSSQPPPAPAPYYAHFATIQPAVHNAVAEHGAVRDPRDYDQQALREAVECAEVPACSRSLGRGEGGNTAANGSIGEGGKGEYGRSPSPSSMSLPSNSIEVGAADNSPMAKSRSPTGNNIKIEREWQTESERCRLHTERLLAASDREKLEAVLRQYRKVTGGGSSLSHSSDISPSRGNAADNTLHSLSPIQDCSTESARSYADAAHQPQGDDTTPRQSQGPNETSMADEKPQGDSYNESLNNKNCTASNVAESSEGPSVIQRQRRQQPRGSKVQGRSRSPPPSHYAKRLEEIRSLYRQADGAPTSSPKGGAPQARSMSAYFRRSPLITPQWGHEGPSEALPLPPPFRREFTHAGPLVETRPVLRWDPQRSGNILISPNGRQCIAEASRAMEIISAEYGGIVPRDVVAPMYALGSLGISEGDFVFEVHLSGGGPNRAYDDGPFRFAVGVTTRHYRGPQRPCLAYLFCSDGVLRTGLHHGATDASTLYGRPFAAGDAVTVVLQLTTGCLSFYLNGVSMGTALRFNLPLHPEPLFPLVVFMREGDGASLEKPSAAYF